MGNQNQKPSVEIVSTNQTLQFTQQASGRLVGFWGRERVLMDSIKMATCVSVGTVVEVDIVQVNTVRSSLLTARPTEATREAFEAAGTWPIGMCRLNLCFRPKADGTGVYAVEPMTGKRVYPGEGFRVWVDGYFDYLCEEVGRIVIARPIVEPEYKGKNPENPDEPHTFKQPRRQQHQPQSRRRNDRRPGQKPVRLTLTFGPRLKGAGIIAFHDDLGRRHIVPAWGRTFLVGHPMECDCVVRGRMAVATPVKDVTELASEIAGEVEVYEATQPKHQSDDRQPHGQGSSKPQEDERQPPRAPEPPLSRMERFRRKHGDIAAPPEMQSDGSSDKPTDPATHDGTLQGQLLQAGLAKGGE